MKKSLIALLSLSALVVTGLAACTPSTSSSSAPSSQTPSSSEPSSSEPSSSEPTATVLSIEAALALDTEPPYSFAYLGERIRIEDASLTTIVGDRAFIQQATGETVGDLFNLELSVADWNGVDSTRQIVTVEGVLNDVNGHAVLEEAVFIEATPDASAGTYYWPGVGRSDLDNAFSRSWHGYWITADVQMVTVPTTVVKGTSQTFKVVFPGEDTNLENPENIFPIDVVIPADITDKEVEAINDWLGGLYYVLNEETEEWDPVQGDPIAAGSFQTLFMMHEYNSYTSSFLFNGSSAANSVPAEIDNVFTTWEGDEELEIEGALDVLISYIVDAGALTTLGSELAYSYLVDIGSFGNVIYGPNVLGGQQYPIVVNMYTYDTDALTDELLTDFEALGFGINDSQAESDGVIFGQNADGITFVIWLGTAGYVEIYFYGISTFYSGVDSADAITAIDTYATLYGAHYVLDEETGEPIDTPHVSAVKPLEDVAEETSVSLLLTEVGYYARVMDENGFLNVLVLDLLALVAAETAEDFEAFVIAYLGLYLEDEAWTPVELTITTEEPAVYLFNQATGEAIVAYWGQYQNSPYYLLDLEIVIFGDYHHPEIPNVE